MLKTIFINCTSQEFGGVIYASYSTSINLKSVNFTSSKAQSGGVIYLEASILNISDALFSNNSAIIS
jgi:hypothetical protein